MASVGLAAVAKGGFFFFFLGSTRKMVPKFAKTVNLPDCDFLSSVIEPLNFFKYAEMKY